ncbi:hypothetical protein [Acidimangrovimonas pyrenivorans]|uniref:Uncharacterized protein n=1 Tax=Acidimangrovimonas pyrenivorans TaxID=2030798 RepID=A0ABV7ALZ3_9RHOB
MIGRLQQAVLLVALAATIALGAWGWWQGHRLASARDQIAALRLSLAAEKAARAQAEQSAAVHRAYLTRAEADAASLRATLTDLQSMEGRDAPLDPVLAATAQRLYGQH